MVLVLGRQPFQTLKNKPIHVQAKNMLPRPCNLYRNLRYERGAPVHIYGENRGILQGAEKNGLTRAVQASFHQFNFYVPFKNSFIHWFWRDRVHLFQKWSSRGPRKRPGRPLSTPGRPGPARVAIGPIKRGTFATRGLTFPIVLRILARNGGFSR